MSSNNDNILYETWKSVHELKAGLKRTEDKLASLKTLKVGSVFTPTQEKIFREVKKVPPLRLQNIAKNVEIKRFQCFASDCSDKDSPDALPYFFNTSLIQHANKDRKLPRIVGKDELAPGHSITTRVLNDDETILLANQHTFEEKKSSTGTPPSDSLSDISSLSTVELLKDTEILNHRPKVNTFFVAKDSNSLSTAPPRLENLKKLTRKQAENHIKRNTDFDIHYEPPQKVTHKDEDHIKVDAIGSWFNQPLKKKPLVRKSCKVSEPVPYRGFSTSHHSVNIDNVGAKNPQGPSGFKHISRSKKPQSSARNVTCVRKVATQSNDRFKKGIITPASWKEDRDHMKKLQGIRKMYINKQDSLVKKASPLGKKPHSSTAECPKALTNQELSIVEVDKAKKLDERPACTSEPLVGAKPKRNEQDDDIPAFDKKSFLQAIDHVDTRQNTLNEHKVEGTLTNPCLEKSAETILKRPTRPTRARKKNFLNLEKKPPPKEIHYDPDEIRQYIEKKRNEQLLKQRHDKLSKRKEMQQKIKRLKGLYQKQKKSVAASIKLHEMAETDAMPRGSYDCEKENWSDLNEIADERSNGGINDEAFQLKGSPPIVQNDFDIDFVKHRIAEDKDKRNQEKAKATEIRAFAERLQSSIDEKSRFITELCKKAAKSQQSSDPLVNEVLIDSRLPDVENISSRPESVADLEIRNKSAVKIQAQWRRYHTRKIANFRQFNLSHMESLSEGSLHSDDEIFSCTLGNNFLNNTSFVRETNANKERESFHENCISRDSPSPDPYNFINTLAKKNIVFNDKFSNKQKENIDKALIPPSQSSNTKTQSYESDFNSVSQIYSSDFSKTVDKVTRSPSVSLKASPSSGSGTHKTPSASDFVSYSDSDLSANDRKRTGVTSESAISEEIEKDSSSTPSISEGLLSLSDDAPQTTASNVKTISRSNENIKSASAPKSSPILSISEGSLFTSDLETESVDSEFVSFEKKSVQSNAVETNDLTEPTSTVTSETVETKMSKSKKLSGEVTLYSSVQTTQSSLQSGISATALQSRMQTELNHLDILDESLQRVRDIERMQTAVLSENRAARAIEFFQKNERRHQEEVSKSLNRILEERMHTENQLKKRLLDHDQCIKLASESIAQVKLETNQLLQNDAKKLISSQAEATKATAEATKKLAEVLKSMNNGRRQKRSYGMTTTSNSDSDLQHSPSTTSWRSTTSEKSKSLNSPSKSTSISSPLDGEHKKSKTEPIEEIQSTAQTSTPTVIVTEQLSVEEGSSAPISEEICEKASDNYSMSFEDSVADEEKLVKPTSSSVLSKRSQESSSKQSSNNTSPSDFEVSAHSLVGEAISSSSQRKLSNSSRSSVLVGPHSLDKFTLDMVKQYMKEGELRSYHQRALLKLREKAVLEKTKAELTWLEWQKKRLKDSGADDKMPPIRKKQRGLLLRLQQEQAEIKRLKSIQKAAEQERQLLFQQQEDIYKLHRSTKQLMDKIKLSSLVGSPLKSLSQLSLASSVRANRCKLSKKAISSSATQASSSPELVAIEADTSLSDVNESSIAEVDTNTPKSTNSVSKSAAKVRSKEPESHQAFVSILQDLKALQASKRNLSKREEKLSLRKQTVEEIIQWHQKLDKEEAEIRAKEKDILKRFELEKWKRLEALHASSSEGDNKYPSLSIGSLSKDRLVQRTSAAKSSSEIRTMSVSDEKDDQSATEAIETIAEEMPSEGKSESESISEDVKTATNESMPFVKTPSTQENSDYSDSFDSEVIRTESVPSTVHRKNVASQSSDLTSHSRPMVSIKPPLSPRSCHTAHKRHDSSGSEDSFTVSLSETASDQSDVEGRIIALREELKQRKLDADRLKRKLERFNPDRLRAQEPSLKKQLEAFEKCIKEAKQYVDLDVRQLQKGAVKPQIKHPESRRLKRQSDPGSSGSSSEVTSPPVIHDKSDIFLKSLEKDVENSKATFKPDQDKTEDVVQDAVPKEPESVTQSIDQLTSVEQNLSGITIDDTNSSISTNIIEEVVDHQVTDKSNSGETSGDISETDLEQKKTISEGPSNEAEIKASNQTYVTEPLCEYSEIFESSITISESLEKEYFKAKNLSETANEFTNAFLDEILAESLGIIFSIDQRNAPDLSRSSVLSEKDRIGTNAATFADAMAAKLLSDALNSILCIYLKRRDSESVSPISNPSTISQRVSSILSEIQEKQSTPPRDRHRPQDLMVLSPILSVDNDDILASENFPFTDVFNEHDEQVVHSHFDSSKNAFNVDILDHQEWFDDDFGLGAKSPGSQKQKDDDSFSPPCYYRKIPNKPPPPYKPPQSGPYSMQNQPNEAVQAKLANSLVTIKPYSAVPSAEAEIVELVKKGALKIIRDYNLGIPSYNIKPPDIDYFHDSDMDIGLESKCCYSYKTFMFDLVKQISMKLLSESGDASQSGKWRSFKSSNLLKKPKPSDEELLKQVEKEVLSQLGFKKELPRVLVSGTGFNAVLCLGQKKRDRVDDILFHELREEEQDWICYDEDELTVKELLVNYILDEITTEAIVLYEAISSRR